MRKALVEATSRWYRAVDNVIVSDQGEVWIRLRSEDGRYMMRAISIAGKLSTIVKLPARTTVAYASRDLFWTIENDADDVPSLVKYELRRSRD